MTDIQQVQSPQQVEAERALFAVTMEKEGWDVTLWMPHKPEAGFDNARTQDLWQGWLARAALSLPAAEVQTSEPVAVTAAAPEKGDHQWVRLLRPLPKGTPLYASPQAAQPVSASGTEGVQACTAHCTWRDHHPDCPRADWHEAAGAVQPASLSGVAAPAGASDNERKLRLMLCSVYAGPLGYYDDGEAQDSREYPFIDFMRDEPQVIQRKIWERSRAALSGAPAAAAEPLMEPTFTADDLAEAAAHCGIGAGHIDMLRGALRHMAAVAELAKAHGIGSHSAAASGQVQPASDSAQ